LEELKMKSLFAIGFACLSLVSGVLFLAMIPHYQIERFAGVACVICFMVSHWFWSNRPSAYHWDFRSQKPRKIRNKYWWIPTRRLQKILLNRYVRQQQLVPNRGGHAGYATWCNVADAELELRAL
jgi:hypothetical protein